jgi:hypothetical protein
MLRICRIHKIYIIYKHTHEVYSPGASLHWRLILEGTWVKSLQISSNSTMDHEIVPKTVNWLRLANAMPAHQTQYKLNLENIQNKQNMQNTQNKRNMQNTYLCCLFPAKREGGREGMGERERSMSAEGGGWLVCEGGACCGEC